jgi:predicted TIM-barrel fold metal-dependent hydrolase
MTGIRLHPDFHGYTLEDPRFQRLMDLATSRGLIVQIGLGMEDPRTQPNTALFAPVQPGPLADLLPRLPKARVVLLNYFRSFGSNRLLFVRLKGLPQISFDMAMVEGIAGLQGMYQAYGSMRLLYGSYAPYYNIESSLLKLQESELTAPQLAAIRYGNASSLLRQA